MSSTRSAVRRIVLTCLSITSLVGATLIAAPAAAAASVPVVMSPTSYASAIPLTASSRMASFDAQMISLVNGARASQGLPTLKEAGGLTQLSVWWSQKMADGATGGALQHNPNYFSMMTSYGASSRTAGAENVAKFSEAASAKAVFDAYMASPGHRANILGSKYRYIGMGTISNGTHAFNTMEFTDKVDGAAPPKKEAPKKDAPKKEAPKKESPKKEASAPSKPATKPSSPKKEQLGKQTTLYATANVNVRSGPSTGYQVVGSLATGQKVVGQSVNSTGWYKIASGKYVSGSVLTTDKPASKPAKKAAREDTSKNDKPTPPKKTEKPEKPQPATGTLHTSIGNLALPGIVLEIRDKDCAATVKKATTGRNGGVSVTVNPGSYCAVAISVPHGIQKPKPVQFTAEPAGTFSVVWEEITPSPRAVPLAQRTNTTLMRPV